MDWSHKCSQVWRPHRAVGLSKPEGWSLPLEPHQHSRHPLASGVGVSCIQEWRYTFYIIPHVCVYVIICERGTCGTIHEYIPSFWCHLYLNHQILLGVTWDYTTTLQDGPLPVIGAHTTTDFGVKKPLLPMFPGPIYKGYPWKAPFISRVTVGMACCMAPFYPNFVSDLQAPCRWL